MPPARNHAETPSMPLAQAIMAKSNAAEAKESQAKKRCHAAMRTRPGTLAPGRWTHLAFVVAADTLTVYVDGLAADTLVAKGHSGLGGFGRMPFASSADGALNGRLAEVRLWKCARTADEIRTMMHHRFEAAGLPDDRCDATGSPTLCTVWSSSQRYICVIPVSFSTYTDAEFFCSVGL